MGSSTPASSSRSPLLVGPDDSALLVVDVQEKLVPLILGHQTLVWNIGRLMDAAGLVGVPVQLTEQYPQGLGPTVDSLAQRAGRTSSPITKTMFSCRECSDRLTGWLAEGRYKVVLAGIETHVCVAQTALDLVAMGFDVYLVVDAVGSRSHVDHAVALRRLEQDGVTPTTTEAMLFEWCIDSAHPQFKAISGLVKARPPSD
jgi:nicotinamidase-related amidase